MQQQSSLKWQGIGVLLTLVVLIVALLVSLSLSAAPASAQGFAEPTATPNDPLWRAFDAARSAIEEERSVDLTLVQSYNFQQEEYIGGIDYICDEDIHPINVRPVYWGWTFWITDLGGRTHQARVSFDLRAVTVCDKIVESTYVPSAESTSEAVVNPDLPAPVAGSGATGSFELGGHVEGLGPSTVEAMNKSGMKWVKKQFRYQLGQSGSAASGMIQDAHGKGFKILIGIVGVPSQMGNFTSYISSYAAFVGEVAALGADAIEVWNEPNIDREWPNGQINGANYTQLLAAAYNAIKTANPNTMVVSGAPAPTGAEAAFPGAVVNDDNFMRQMAAAGAANYIDCVGLHYNEGIVSPATNAGDPRGEYPTYYFSSMTARGRASFPGIPVCYTELGYLSGEGMGSPIPPSFAWAGDVTVAQHAAWLADAASRAAQTGYIRLMIIWNVNFQRWDSDPMGGYAIIRPDGTCPACSTLGAVMKG